MLQHACAVGASVCDVTAVWRHLPQHRSFCCSIYLRAAVDERGAIRKPFAPCCSCVTSPMCDVMQHRIFCRKPTRPRYHKFTAWAKYNQRFAVGTCILYIHASYVIWCILYIHVRHNENKQNEWKIWPKNTYLIWWNKLCYKTQFDVFCLILTKICDRNINPRPVRAFLITRTVRGGGWLVRPPLAIGPWWS